MPVLMPTARLWKELGAPYALAQQGPSKDSVLGDWALKYIDVRQGRFIIGVNERTFMAVAFARRPLSHLVSTFLTCVGAQLEVFNISPARITTEVAALEAVTFAKNRNRSLLGILNEVALQFEVEAEHSDISSADELLEIQTKLNHIPHLAGSPSCVFARDAIVGALGTETIH